MSDDGVTGETIRVGSGSRLCCVVLCAVLYVRVCIDKPSHVRIIESAATRVNVNSKSLGYSRLITLKISSSPVANHHDWPPHLPTGEEEEHKPGSPKAMPQPSARQSEQLKRKTTT
jgi:hypothetical protein